MSLNVSCRTTVEVAHIAFSAFGRTAVRNFYANALQAGDGLMGPRLVVVAPTARIASRSLFSTTMEIV
jgi:hypothetical protein